MSLKAHLHLPRLLVSVCTIARTFPRERYIPAHPIISLLQRYVCISGTQAALPNTVRANNCHFVMQTTHAVFCNPDLLPSFFASQINSALAASHTCIAENLIVFVSFPYYAWNVTAKFLSYTLSHVFRNRAGIAVNTVTGLRIGRPTDRLPFSGKGQEIFHFSKAWISDMGPTQPPIKYEGWNFNSGNYLFTTDTK